MSLLCLEVTAQTPSVNLYTIPNQSASFVRMPSRDATTEIDAVFFNPAGLTKLEEGFHLSLSNQFLRQGTNVSTDYQYLNEVPTEYKGALGSPIFPSVFFSWNRGRFATSFAFMLVAGGGAADLENIPVSDIGISDIPEAMRVFILDDIDASVAASTGVDPGYGDIAGYAFEFSNTGLGYYPGVQLGLSYRISDMFSVGLAGRRINAYVQTEGYVRNIQVDVPQYGGKQSPGDYMRNVVLQDPNLDIVEKSLIRAAAQVYEDLGRDREIDVVEKGTGYTPIISLNVTPHKKLNLSVKYEHNTKVEIETEVKDSADGGGEFVDGKVIRSDLPGLIALGASYEPHPKVTVNFGWRYLLWKGANWNGRDSLINKNYFEVALGAEYRLFERGALSAGFTIAKPNVQDGFHNDVDYALTGYTGAFGGYFQATPTLKLNAGVLFTVYTSKTINTPHEFADGFIDQPPIFHNQTYDKNALIFALGLDFSFLRDKEKDSSAGEEEF